MKSTTAAPEPRQLTAKGQATRARILEHAAALIYAEGVHATNNDKLRRAAGVSGSQINHYFPTKESLVLAVIEWQAERVLGLHRGEQFDGFESLEGFRKWAAFYIGYERAYHEGCSLGSLASEIIKTDLDVHDELAAAFAQWREIFRDALLRLQRQGRLSNEADAEKLAGLLLAAFQGGMLLAQVARGISPLRDALETALDYIETFATPRPRSANR
ncbi:TetR/AcrR family transcriptional regulator [Micromonospora musae]|uniref:TetR/AcrR family transcriptional regulator n=1 Tax=Micromonospora musae TaxID=1894970 RepID=A0A3A9Y3L9_9ACTN|nr:TetR/AcrR family transcriptional regulator [Micromonospora musae]RKN20835.1 TetR/AcrR family transcriptional regulator [Micromonospora musae]RKN32360.1 TetR/AcrR family transcriptional regulator [Micromonospora musae]